MPIRLHQIAQRANVATSTVSRVLNGYPYVSVTTREAVWRAAKEMGLERHDRPQPVVTVVLTDMCRAPDISATEDEHVIGSEFARQVLSGAQSALSQCGRLPAHRREH